MPMKGEQNQPSGLRVIWTALDSRRIPQVAADPDFHERSTLSNQPLQIYGNSPLRMAGMPQRNHPFPDNGYVDRTWPPLATHVSKSKPPKPFLQSGASTSSKKVWCFSPECPLKLVSRNSEQRYLQGLTHGFLKEKPPSSGAVAGA